MYIGSLAINHLSASKGTWMMVDGEWYCYDKSGDAYTSTFCSSNGKEYYVGDDGALVRSSWVEYDRDYYFVNSSGQKVTNDWRLTAPYDDDSAEEEWFYFKSNGKRAEDEKITYKGKTYFFDSEGEMLTGWVQKSGDGWVAKTGSNGYEQVWNDDDDTDGHYDTKLSELDAAEIHFCGNEDDGHMKKGKWVKAFSNTEFGEDDKYEVKDVTVYIVANDQTTEERASFIVNKSGSIQTASKEYKDDDDVLIDASHYSFSATKGALYKSFATSSVATPTPSNATAE